MTLILPPISPAPRQIQLLKYGVNYPDVGKVLTAAAAPVDVFDARLRRLVADMFHTMYKANGVGLAAPQIGLGMRIAVVDVSVKHEPGSKIVLVNPTITGSSNPRIELEGCLSLPGFVDKVSRPEHISVTAQDEFGEWRDIQAEGLLARALQHEVDHLEGKLYINRISSLKRSLMLGKIKKLKRQGRW